MVEDFSKCIGCRECISACQTGALTLKNRQLVKNHENCILCYECLEICPAMVFETVGWAATTSQLLDTIKKDRTADKKITFSGGEPLFQPEGLITLLTECEKLDIHRTVVTSCYAEKDTVLKVAGKTDRFLIDLKIMDREKHLHHTGVDNRIILSNIRTLAEHKAEIIIRVPQVRGVNDDPHNLQEVTAFVNSLNRDIPVKQYPLKHSDLR